MRIIYMGSSDFGLPSLMSIAGNYDVIAVYTNPPKPAGRGLKLQPTPIQVFAEEVGIPCFTPTSLKQEYDVIADLRPDVIVVAAYGKILPDFILNIPKYGCINIHGSILPRWRGAAPIQYALLSGDKTTGVTIMKMDAGMDTGDIILTGEYPLSLEDNVVTVFETLSKLGSKLIMRFLNDPQYFLNNKKAQDHQLATYTKKLTKEDMRIDFCNAADGIINQIRAFYPKAWFSLCGSKIQVLSAEKVVMQTNSDVSTILDKNFLVSCGNNEAIKLLLIKPESKRVMTGDEFLLSKPDFLGQVINR